MKILTKNQILFLHEELIKIFGGNGGIRDENLLESAIFSPRQTFGGQDLYPTIIEKAARLGYGLVKNHPFFDGNKRIGAHAMLIFLSINNLEINYSDDEFVKLIFGVADNSIGYEKFLDWLKSHIKI